MSTISHGDVRKATLQPILFLGTGMFATGATALGVIAATEGGGKEAGLAVTYGVCFVVLVLAIALLRRDRVQLACTVALLAWTAQAAVAGVLGSAIAALTIAAVSFAIAIFLATLLDPDAVLPWAGVQALCWAGVVSVRYAVAPGMLEADAFWPSMIVPAFLLFVLGLTGRAIGRYRDRAIDDALTAYRRASEADDASAAKSLFLANMSHELRTPLNAIIGYTQLVQEDLDEHTIPECLDDLAKVEVAGKHLLQLINNVLDLSKIEAGRLELEHRPYQLDNVIHEVGRTLRPLLEAKGNELVVEAHLSARELVGDEMRLRQVLLNLVGNANKFTEAGTVRLVAEEVEGMVRVAVADTGIGMDETQCQKVFQPFQQAESSTTRRYGGTGLGLAISASLAKHMGGHIDVASEPGEGSTFTLTVPCEMPTAA